MAFAKDSGDSCNSCSIKFFAWYMLNTDYTNNTNVDEWRLRKIRAIRDIRVPSKIFDYIRRRLVLSTHRFHRDAMTNACYFASK